MSPTPIYIVTTSQTPLPIRFPRPRKPILLLPPLIHRALHSALDARPPSAIASSSGIIIPHPESLVKHDVPSRAFPSQMTPRSDTSSPSADPDETDDIDAEVTVKLHLVGRAPTSTRAGWVTESLAFLARYKGLGSVDNLLIGFNGVDYKGRKTAASEMFGCGTEGLEGGSGSDVVDEETERGMREVWDEVSRGGGGVGGRVGRMGTMYLPLGLLRALSEAEVAPRINAMDTPDCQSLPKEYSGFAREKGIELWAGGGGEGADPLPDADLHNLLQEFTASLSPLLSTHSETPPSPHHPLSAPIPLRADGLKYDDTVERGVSVRWVLSYTLFSKTRNVLKDKGYIVAAELL